MGKIKSVIELERLKGEAAARCLRHRVVFTPKDSSVRRMGYVKQVIADKRAGRILLGIVYDTQGGEMRCVRNYGDPSVVVLNDFIPFTENRGRKKTKVVDRAAAREEAIKATENVGMRCAFKAFGAFGLGQLRPQKEGRIVGVSAASKSHRLQYRIIADDGAEHFKSVDAPDLAILGDTASGPAMREAMRSKMLRRDRRSKLSELIDL